MGILKFIGFVLFIIAVIGIVLFIFDWSLFFNILYHIIVLFNNGNQTYYSSNNSSSGIYNGNQTCSSSNSSNNSSSGIDSVSANVRDDLAGIEQVIPANQIKVIRTFVNPTTSYTCQLLSYKDLEFRGINNTDVCYNGTCAPAGLFATGDIYNNGTFTNYMPWLQGKIVYVQFPVHAYCGFPTLRALRNVSLPYLVTKVYRKGNEFYYNFISLPYLVAEVYIKGNEFYYNFMQAFSPTNPVLVNIENLTFAQIDNTTTYSPFGFFYNGTEYIVFFYSGRRHLIC